MRKTFSIFTPEGKCRCVVTCAPERLSVLMREGEEAREGRHVSRASSGSLVAAIQDLERRQQRPLRELAINAGNEDARNRLASIEAEIAALRARL